ncbi:MerR family transcriptional regulator [Paenibacillus sp. FSL H7-0331]|uniref:MerR family transcriptional regulator n=1 Tax=Paenibacillus sp. FSL H7-0331 TaxID=1920421 RepID=UPI00096F862F|nr:MerR family transcriptional regulator [Paenibacillus sp. FSL H7-0331]OMF03594.1 MerR family transcriptional regulator [Paenibacillus sp. FSL H7-0331]
MSYTVNDVSKKTGISAHTLRFYEKQGVLPYAERNDNGVRLYDESSIEWIETIISLRSTGMPLAELKQYVELHKEGDQTLLERKKMMVDHKVRVEEQMLQLMKTLGKINYKMALYDVQLQQLERDSCAL